ncbi:hypothetical protein KY290_009011 [Solanum tuberosum]|uniref:Wax synthase domain-containing protein n=1 Tax=Solanum tuberosum TaxID=4113 RepID=A0ABQ7WC95_SOLTU|nr:hypothetical protein KY284_008959 [Solanum tuberosum]KAH0777600.1 hypothetical protein KY290_009011 [Solanum tuberosum]
MLNIVSIAVRVVSRVELEPAINNPHMASSLQDFWGKRWNLMVTNILRLTIYDPVRSVIKDRIPRRWAPIPAVLATFFVSGLMHELFFYYIGRLKPSGEAMMFFLIHGVALSVEIVIKKIFNGKSLVPRIISEIIFNMISAVVRGVSRVELEPPFDEPYLASSLQDFWGKRWNLMVTNILRPTVYDPVRSIVADRISRKWAPLPAVLATFFVSGLMHELIFNYNGRLMPNGLATFKLILFALGKGPLSSTPPLPLSTFIPLACLPIKLKKSSKTKDIETIKKTTNSTFNLVTKITLLAILIRVYNYKDNLHPKFILFCYCINIYIMLEIILNMVSSAVRRVSRVDLDPPFNEPYLTSSLQDFWGKRWNLMVSNILRLTVYDPVHLFVADRIPRKWAPIPAVLATFIVSGLVHELLLYYIIERLKPSGEAMIFFLIHGVALSVEIVIKKMFNGKILVPRIISEIILIMVSTTVRRVSRVELEPPFNEPYLASSLQDFWGKRWNLMVTNILHPTVYDPIHSMVADRISRKWAPLPAVIATFFVSGLMHELIFYYNGRLKPNGEVMMFFLIHGVALSLEIVIKKIFNGKFLVPRIISGKQAKGMNVESGRGGIDDKGPLPKAKRRILKLASHAMKKEVVPPRLIEVR